MNTDINILIILILVAVSGVLIFIFNKKNNESNSKLTEDVKAVNIQRTKFPVLIETDTLTNQTENTLVKEEKSKKRNLSDLNLIKETVTLRRNDNQIENLKLNKTISPEVKVSSNTKKDRPKINNDLKSSLFKASNLYFDNINWDNKKVEVKDLDQLVTLKKDEITVNSLFFRSNQYFNLFNWEGKNKFVLEKIEVKLSTVDETKKSEKSKALFYSTKSFFKNTSWENKAEQDNQNIGVATLTNNTKSFVSGFIWD